MPQFRRKILFANARTRIARVVCDGCDGPRPREETAETDQLAVVLQGRFSLREREGTLALGPQRAKVFVSGEPHVIAHSNDEGDVCLTIDSPIVGELRDRKARSIDVSVEAWIRIRKLAATLARGEHVSELAIDEVLATLRAPIDEPPKTKRAREIAAAIAHQLELRFDESLALADLAADAGVTTYHACRVFREVTGSPIHRAQLEIQLRHALALVLDADLPLADIAMKTGFSDQAHFTNRFTRRFGHSPHRVRKGAQPEPVRAAIGGAAPGLLGRRR